MKAPSSEFRDSIAWLSGSLSTLRDVGHPITTQDSLMTARLSSIIWDSHPPGYVRKFQFTTSCRELPPSTALLGARVQSFQQALGNLISIDGKTLRKSFDKASGKSPIHMVSAFAAASKLVLGQQKISDKSNEITAIPKLLELLALEGMIVSIDAMGTQKEIARKIREKKADYVLALKGNHSTLHDDIRTRR